MILLCFIPTLLLAKSPCKILDLNNNWQFSQTNKDEWHPATVPGSVQRDLLKLNILPDPYYGTNEEKVKWVEDEKMGFSEKF